MLRATVIPHRHRIIPPVKAYGEFRLLDMLVEQFANSPSQGMFLMGILSDVQELITHDSEKSNERARQYMNRSKFLMSEYLPKDNEGDVTELPETVQESLEFVYAETLDDVMAVALRPAAD